MVGDGMCDWGGIPVAVMRCMNRTKCFLGEIMVGLVHWLRRSGDILSFAST